MSSSYNYVVTAHRPTVATHAVTANFTSPNEQNLILAKNTRLEIHLLTAEGLQTLFDLPVHGQITALQVFRPRVHPFYRFSSGFILTLELISVFSE
jgi:DNA damage-binding protein 1